VKKFLLVRGESGRMYLYNREVWQYMAERDNTYKFVVVTENDDPEVLKQMQALVNDDIEIED
jgi:hypothetical protein